MSRRNKAVKRPVPPDPRYDSQTVSKFVNNLMFEGKKSFAEGIFYSAMDLIEERTGREARAVVLGHVQRGGTPSPFDRVLATRFGLAALDAVHEGDSGVMVALRGTDIVRVPLAEATAQLKLVPVERYAEVEVFFG